MKWFIPILAASILAGGCAQHTISPSPATMPVQATAVDPKANLTLDEIQPVPVMPTPATQPSTPTPDRALELFAQALDDLQLHHPYPAIDALDEAIQLDPDSADLYYTLGRAQLERLQIPSDKSFDAFESAAAIRPDDLQIQLLLGRQYLAVGNEEKALQHLRLAKISTGYQKKQNGSAAVEVFLARTLEQMGYFRAALNEFLLIEQRLKHPTRELSLDPDTSFIAGTPQIVTLEIGTLHERLGENEQALQSFQSIADQDPANFALQAKMIELLVKLGRQDQAIGQAADVVATFGANSESLTLLHATCQMVAPQRELEVLQNLHQKKPDDNGILFALADVLAQQGQRDAALQLLTDAAAAHPADGQILRKLFELNVGGGNVQAAATLLIDRLAASPDSVDDINSLFTEIIRPASKNPLRLSQLQALQVPSSEQAAKLYLVAEAAELWQRDALVRSSINQAVKIMPPFPPAYRRFVLLAWSQPDLSTEQKKAACEALAQTAQAAGNASLATEVLGLNLLSQDDINGASDTLREAIRLGGTSPDLQLTYATILAQQKQILQCEQALWKLIAQRPQYDQAWSALHAIYDNTNRPTQAVQVLAEWLRINPGSPTARILEAEWTGQHGQEQTAIDSLVKILQDHSDDVQIILKVESVFVEFHREQEFVGRLVSLHHDQPTNLTVLGMLVDIAQRAGQLPQAVQLIDESRIAVGNDPDLLYEISALYHEANQTDTSNEILSQILKIDPGNVPASNDLGFSWADSGINLTEAERLIRVAVNAEPDNQAFLDSLGWVLYKQAKFAQAIPYFQEAIGPAALPNPQVLDHYGDDLYRLGRVNEAQGQWLRALRGLSEERDSDPEDIALRQSLQDKLTGSGTSRPVDVAPLAPTTQTSQSSGQ
jgi:predicted Zn-dependent protease